MRCTFLFLTLILLSFKVEAQSGLGVIKVSAFSNNDNKIKNNIKITSLDLLITESKTNDTISNGIVELPLKLNVEPGDYILKASIPNYSKIEIIINVSMDKITFIDLLFEPKKQKREKYVTGLN